MWCNHRDGCGIVCVVITYFLLAFAEYAVVFKVVIPWFGSSFYSLVHVCAFTALVGLAYASHFKAMTTNPGAVPPEAIPLDYNPERPEPYKMCRKCNAFKPPRAHHCSLCNRCITKNGPPLSLGEQLRCPVQSQILSSLCFYVWASSMYAISLVMGHFFMCGSRKSSCYINGPA